MKYNIKLHILDHSTYIQNNLIGTDRQLIHFNSSVCQTYFIRNGITTQNEIDKIMIDILKNFSKKEISIREKNGTYLKKNGKVVQRYRTRTIRFKNMLSAFHSRHFDSSKAVNPHFHFLFPTNARMGKDFMYLKQALKEEAIKHKIKFNFMEERQVTGLSKKQLSRIESLSWLLNQGNTTKIKQYLLNNKKIIEALDLLQIHYRNTQNISYFIKILPILNQRLKELDIDFKYKNINIKESIYFLLNEKQKSLLLSLENGRTVDLNLSNVLDREILKKAHNFQNDAMEVISKKFNLTTLSPKQLKYVKKNDSDNPDAYKTSSFRKLIMKDLRNALAYAKSEKDWKNILVKIGYKKVSINTTKTSNKRVKTGITVTTKKKTKVYIPFHKMGLDFREITKIMIHNRKRNPKKDNYDNKFDNYTKRKKRLHDTWKKYTVQMQLLLQIYSNSKIDKENNEEVLKRLASKYIIYTSKMYDITTYQTESTTIIDSTITISLKKSTSDIEKTISDMLDIAVIKGWDLKSLTIKGSYEFVNEVKKQIKRRLEPEKIPKIIINHNISSNLKI